MSELVLEVKDIAVEFPVQGSVHRALDGVSLKLYQGETLAVVGESGCGKTTLARCILGLQDRVQGDIIASGEYVNGTRPDLASRVGMVWQDPFASVNPKWTVERSILEPARLARRRIDLDPILREVGLDPKLSGRYPHQLSGGQRQRVAIGRALALRPPLVICDEPTAALDLSIQAQILNLLKDIQSELHCAYLYISHDLMTVRYLADRVAVMYMGRIVEEGPTEEIFRFPKHPYTKALLDSAPVIENLGHLPQAVKGELPDPKTKLLGCRFASRCMNVQEKCLQVDPEQREIGHVRVWCFNPNNVSNSSRDLLS